MIDQFLKRHGNIHFIFYCVTKHERKRIRSFIPSATILYHNLLHWNILLYILSEDSFLSLFIDQLFNVSSCLPAVLFYCQWIDWCLYPNKTHKKPKKKKKNEKKTKNKLKSISFQYLNMWLFWKHVTVCYFSNFKFKESRKHKIKRGEICLQECHISQVFF